ncbi:hypothetical protein DAMA08_020140 [Martiniozyma asiatica (nom. inval.)]|nr:hypothetical protein DAMA08_020140 [Martiniozyma asiatica]
MGAAYTILGKAVPSHYLAIGTLASVVGGVKLNSFLGASEKPAAAPAAAPAAPKDELDVEKAISDFLSSSEKESN